MGACSSCLGFGRRRDRGVENPETSRLLYDDPYRSQYGTTGQIQHRTHYQPDPESIRRETEALEGICHDMSDDVLDVFTSLPQSTHTNSNLASSPSTSTNEGTQMAKTGNENTTKRHRPTQQWTTYKSVRAAPSGGHIWRDLNKYPKGWEEAKAVIEGPGG